MWTRRTFLIGRVRGCRVGGPCFEGGWCCCGACDGWLMLHELEWFYCYCYSLHWLVFVQNLVVVEVVDIVEMVGERTRELGEYPEGEMRRSLSFSSYFAVIDFRMTNENLSFDFYCALFCARSSFVSLNTREHFHCLRQNKNERIKSSRENE